jgi:SRSO17 transposase
VKDLWRRGGPSWETYRIKDTEKGPLVWRVREGRFYPSEDGVPGEALRVIVAVNVLDGEVKYFLSNAPDEVPLWELLAVAFSRWHIEKLYQEGKGEVGMHHFEVRCYRSLIRHLVLTNVSLYFLAEQTEILRGEKSGLVDLPVAPGCGGPVGTGRSAA